MGVGFNEVTKGSVRLLKGDLGRWEPAVTAAPSARVVLCRLGSSRVDRLVVGCAGPVRDDPAVADADHPGAGGLAFGSAGTTAEPEAARHQDAVSEVNVLAPVWLEHVPKFPGLLKVCAHAIVAAVSTGSHAGPRQRQELNVWVIEPQERVEIPAA